MGKKKKAKKLGQKLPFLLLFGYTCTSFSQTSNTIQIKPPFTKS
jgi:hypothetical protein